jgi:cell wall-associated NlpC family hydrolase
MSFHRLFSLGTTCWLLGACTIVGAPASSGPTEVVPPPPFTGAPVGPAPAEPVADTDAPPESSRITAQVVQIALESIGTPYVWGGTSADGFDCSGLIQFAYGQVGILLPRISRAQIGSGAPVVPDPRSLRPGDVLGFSDDGDGRTDHVGLYVGGGDFIHSSSSGVRVSGLGNPYWREKLVAARRIVE